MKEVTLIVGKLNCGWTGFWQTDAKSIRIGSYAIVENKDGYDLVRMVGIVRTTLEMAMELTNHANLKNVVRIVGDL